MIKFRKYIVEFEVRTENTNPDEMFKTLINDINTDSDSLERIKVISISPKIHRRVKND